MMRREWIGVTLAVIVALALRLVGIGWGAPTDGRYLSWSPDEGSFTSMLYRMDPFHLNFNPGRFDIPSFTPYALAASLLVGSALGIVELRPDKAYYVAHLDQWGRIFLAGRLVSVLCAALSVVATYALIRRMYAGCPRWLPLLGAVLLAIAPGHVAWSHYLSQNPLVTFWILAAFYSLAALVEKPTTRNYLLAGLFSGIAFSTNYNALMLFPLIPLAHVLACPQGVGIKAWFALQGLKRLLLAALATVAGFVIVTPYAILDFQNFLYWVTWVNRNLSGGLESVGLGESARRLFLDVLPATIGWGTYLLGVAGMVWTVGNSHRRRVEWLSLAFILLFILAVICSGHRLSVGRLLPMAVMWLLPTVGLIGALWQRQQRAVRSGVVALAIVALGTTFVPALAVDTYFIRDTVRRDASAWIQAHIPRGTTVGTIWEPYYFTPDILGLDYHYPEVNGRLYQYWVYMFNGDQLREFPADFVIVASQELGVRFEESKEPTKITFRTILDTEYNRVAEFSLCERLGWACPVLKCHPDLFSNLWPAPDVWVYQRIGE